MIVSHYVVFDENQFLFTPSTSVTCSPLDLDCVTTCVPVVYLGSMPKPHGVLSSHSGTQVSASPIVRLSQSLGCSIDSSSSTTSPFIEIGHVLLHLRFQLLLFMMMLFFTTADSFHQYSSYG